MIVGLTGGIGSGKTTVASVFAHFKVPVYSADEASKKLIDSDADLQKALKELLGEEVVKQGKIDRAYMASLIFSDEGLLQKTNQLIHPAVGRDFKKWMQQQEEGSPYVIREAAILFESGSYRDCDKIIVVSAPREMRVERVMQRSHATRAQVLQRMAHQWPEKEKLERADYVVKNDLTESILKQVAAIHEDIVRQTNPPS